MSKDLLDRIDETLKAPWIDEKIINPLLADLKEHITYLYVELSMRDAEINRLKNHFRLAEECSEVIKVSSKSARFGDEFINPVTGICNSKELMQECADVQVAIEDMNYPTEDFLEAKATKRIKLREFKQKEV